MSDAFEGLGEYLGVFSDLGNVPTSIVGYGYSSARHRAELRGLGADESSQQTDAPAGPKPSPTTLQIGTQRWQELRAMLVKDVQWGLNQLGYKLPVTGNLGSQTKAAWAKYVSLFTRLDNAQPYAPDFIPASGGFDSSHWVWANTYALADLGARAKQASSKPAASPSKPATAPSGKTTPAAQVSQKPAPAPSTAGNLFVTSVASVQDILVRLGWRGDNTTSGPISKKLTDGEYGETTAKNWVRSANKRKLNNTIERVDGYTVRVDQNTFLQLKAVADQMSPPTSNQPVVPAPGGTTTITEARLNEVLGRLAGAPAGAKQTYDRLVSDYQARAKNGGLDTSISKDQSGGIVVNTKTWNAFLAAANTLPVPAPAPVAPAQKSAVDKAMAEVVKNATSTINSSELRDYFNIAIQQGILKNHEPFAGDTWNPEYASLILKVANAVEPWKTAWTQLLVPGKLVSTDLLTAKLYPQRVADIRKTLATYKAQQQKAATAVRPGFTKVTTSQVIGWVNDLNISNKAFNTAGGAQETADALRTFLDNTKQAAPTEIVWVQSQTKDVFVNDDVLKKLAAATKDESARAQATQTYRDKIVSDALTASTASVTVDQLQLAFLETVDSSSDWKAKRTDEKRYFGKVKNTGTFDGPTKTAYTELARTLIIGPSIQQYQKLLQAQLGPNFKADLVTQVQNKVWSDYLAKAVSGTTIKTLPVIAKNVTEAAAARKARLGQKALDQQKQQAAKQLIADTIAKSTFIISVFDVQQGLLEAQARKELTATGIAVTGRTSDALRKVMETYIFGMIFPKDANISNADWTTYLNNIGINAAGNKATFGWNNANWLSLTQSAANYLSERSGAWMAKHGKPKGYDGVAKIPLTDARFSKATVITVKIPAKKQPAKTDLQKKLEAEAAKLKKQIASDLAAAKKAQAEAKAKQAAADAAKAKAAQDASNAAAQAAAAKAQADADAAAKAAAAQAAQLQQTQQQVAQNTQAQQQAAQQAAAQQPADVAFTTTQAPPIVAGGPTPNPPPVPFPDTGVPDFTPAPAAPTDTTAAPAPTPAPDATPAPAEASMISPGALLAMSAVGLGFLFLGGDKQDKQRQTRYSTSRRRT